MFSQAQAVPVEYVRAPMANFRCKAEFSGDDRTSVETYLFFIFKAALHQYQILLWEDQRLLIVETLNEGPLKWYQGKAPYLEAWEQFEAAITAQYSRKSNEEELMGKIHAPEADYFSKGLRLSVERVGGIRK